MIDARQGKLTLRLSNKEVDFKDFNSYKIPSSLVSCNCMQVFYISDGAISSKYLNIRKSCLGTLENPKPCKELIGLAKYVY
ncbi:hypothetical protein CR513_62615, partial [Mucuna pruriens]